MSAQLINALIQFHTNDEDKDGDTHVTVTVYNLEGLVTARVDGDFGGFPNNSDSGPYSLVIQNPIQKAILQGGRVTIRIDPNGHDTWRFNWNLTLVFSDQSRLSVGVDGVQLSQNENTFVYWLNGIFQSPARL